MADFLLAIAPYLGSGFIVTILGYFLKAILEYHYNKKKEEIQKKRTVYENLVKSLQVFISGRRAEEDKELFLSSYANSWLWSSDEVIITLGDFIDTQVEMAKIPKDGAAYKKLDETSKAKYTECLLAMRKNLGFKKTELTNTDHRFVSF